MTPERWERVERLYHTALQHQGSERGAYLADACGSDQELRREVESLLRETGAEWPGLEAGALAVAAPLVSDSTASSMIGRRIGPYEIAGLIGSGGMGDVYRARDSRLGRDVAIKILPAAFKQDPERTARFQREAQLLASLNHPNIGAVYGLEEADDAKALVMEMVEGDDLSTRLAQGLLPVETALAIARQIAEALEAAHDREIVHRDLKPANVKVRRDGTVKVLDFGLAKALRPSPSETSPLSSVFHQPGALMGTPAYMSPEQVRGMAVGREADIWAFGVVLYELLTGHSPFARPTRDETLSAVLGPAPDDSLLPADVPASVRRLVRRCLEKDPRRRLKHIGDARTELDDAVIAATTGAGPRPAPAQLVSEPLESRLASRRVPTTALLAVTCAVLALAVGLLLLRSPSQPWVEYSATRVTFDEGLTTDPAISPDGRLIAFASDRSGEDHLDLYVQQTAGGPAVRLTSTAGDDHQPSFSPDGSAIVFRSERGGGGLYVMPSIGGEARLVVRGGYQGRFSPDGRYIAYTTTRPVGGPYALSGHCYVVPVEGGEPRLLTGGFRGAMYPVWLDSRTVLFNGRPPDEGEGARWWTTDIESPRPVQSMALQASVRDVAFDHTSRQLVFVSDARGDSGSIWTVSVDSLTGKTDVPRRVTRGMEDEARIAVASDGTIAAVRASVSVNIWSLPVGGRDGTPTQLTFDAAPKGWPDVSADGRYIAYASARSGNWDLYLLDLADGRETPVGTSPLQEMYPLFTARGTRVAYAQYQRPGLSSAQPPDTPVKVFTYPVAGGVPQLIASAPLRRFDQLSEDGHYIVWHSGGDPSAQVLDLASNKSHVILRPESPRAIYQLRISHDGKWITFLVKADEADSRIYGARFGGVRPIPTAEWIPLTKGVAGEDKPRLSADNRRLFFTSETDGYRCIWMQTLDPGTLRPMGEPVAVHHFHSARRSLARVLLNLQETAISRDRLVFNMAETTGNVWLFRPQSQ